MKHLRGIPILKICMLLFSLLMLQPEEAEASHFRYGNITWERVAGNPYQIRFKVTQSWRLSAFNVNVGQTINPGTPLITGVSTQNVNLVVTSVNTTEDWLYGEYTYVQTYPTTTANYTASFSSCCRIGSPLVNNSNGNFTVSSIVTVGNANDAPVSTVPPFISLPVNTTAATYQLPVVDPNGDALTFSLTPNGQFGSGTTQPSGISISSSGLITFNTVGKTVGQFYNTSVYVTDSKGARIQIDVMIRITNPSTPPVFDYTVTPANNASYVLQPGQPLSFSVKASDTDPGASVSLSAVGVPPGATFSPTSGNPVTQTFSWTPTVANVGTYQVNFVAQDNVGIQTNSIVNIVVSQRPNFVAPSLVSGSILCYTPGQTITQTYTASDVDTADRVRLSLATASQTGMSFSPSLPTTAANPTTTNFTWVTSTANWGINTVVVRATDNYNETNDDTVFYIVNNPPLFATTQADVSITAGQLFSYTFSGTDVNIAQGDVISLSHTHYPSWMTIVNNNNGTWTISGTPSLSDSGDHHISLQLEDLTNHFRGTHCGSATQNFEVTVLPCNILTVPVAANVLCNGGATGAITLNVVNATNPVTYAWNNSASTRNITGLTVGTYTVAITDANGCTAADTVVITEPTAIITSTTSTDNVCSTDNNGTIDLTVSGGVSPYSYQWSNGDFTEDISSLYTGIYTVNVTDANGCPANARDTVFVTDNIAPSITCPANVSVNNDLNACGAVVVYTTPVGTDNCSGVTTTQTAGLASGSLFPIGTTTNTFSVTDANGNSTSCSFTVTVTDNEAPSITCPGNISVNSAASICGAVVTYTVPVGTDNCGVASTVQTAGLASGATFPVGTTTNTFLVTDVYGKTANCSFTVTVADSVAPTAICKNATVYLDGSGNASISVPDINNGSSDNCGIANMSVSPTTFNCSNLGSNTVTLTVKDNSTISSGATVDQQNGPGNTPSGWGDVAQSFTAGTSGNLVGLEIKASYNFSSTATLSIYQGAGTGGTLLSTQTVNLPNAGGGATQVVQYTLPTPVAITAGNVYSYALQNSFGIVLGVNTGGNTYAGGQVYNGGTNGGAPFNTWDFYFKTLMSTSGNTSTCTSTVTVLDTIKPVVTCPANISVNSTSGQCGASVNFAASATDNCGTGALTYAYSQNPGTLFAVGTTTVTVTAKDASNNISAPCSFTVTVTDNEAPSITCPANISVNNDLNACGAVVVYTTPVGTDNCSGVTTTQTAGLASGSLFPVGTTTNTFKVTDANGNSTSCSFTVTVADNEAPSITCASNVSVNNDASVCGAVVNYATPITSDNCGVAGTVQTAGLASGSTFPVGTTTNTFVVTDVNGNTNTCSFTVTVTDNEAPSITCAANISVNNDATVCGAVVNYATPSTSDNCGVAGTVQTAGLASGSTFPIGTTTNTFVVTDVNGNTNTCSFTVTVVDNEAPVITCPANISVNNDATVCGAVVNYATPSTSDNCGVAGTVQTAGWASGATFPVGTTTNTFVVTDVNGNTNTCSFAVTVVDNEAPVVVTQNQTIYLDANGNASITANDINNNSTDNCGIQSMSLSQTAFSCSNVGANTVTLTVTDIYNNSATNTASVTVVDTVKPVITCPSNVTVSCLTQPANTGTATATDACGIDTITYADASTYSANPADAAHYNYTISRTWTVVDNNGNSSSCTQTITVQQLNTTAQVTNVACNGGNSGSIDLSVAGGVGSLSYSWSNGATTQDVNGLIAGTYTVVVTDGAGCTQTTSYTVAEPTVLVASAISVSPNPTVAGQSMNTIYLGYGAQSVTLSSTASGGTPGYTYSWTPTTGVANATSATTSVAPVVTTTYTLTVTDANGCIRTVSKTIYVMDVRVGNNKVKLCHNGHTISVSVNSVPSHLAHGDQLGKCFEVDANTTKVSCYGGNNGSINATVTGGVPPYTYSWSNGATTEDISGLTAGNYTLTVTAANGAITSGTFTVSQNSKININGSVTHVKCHGESTGKINLSVSGGDDPYSYVWNDASTSKNRSNLAAGTYIVTVTDDKGCTMKDTFVITQPATPISVTSVITHVKCYGSSTGKIDITVTGGTGSYSYNWSQGNINSDDDDDYGDDDDNNNNDDDDNGDDDNGDDDDNNNYGDDDDGGNCSTQDNVNLKAGTYTVKVKDANGCEKIVTFTILQPSAIAGTIAVNPNPTVAGQSPNTIFRGYGPQSVTLTASASGGTPGYTYSWSPTSGVGSPTSASTTVTPTNTTTYKVTITDANGCKKEVTKKIEVEDVRSSGDKIKLCHNGNTISVSQSSVAAHLAHGDNLGSCNSGCKDCKDPKEEANQDTHEESMVSDIAVTYEMKVYPNPNNGIFEVKLPSKDEAIIIISNVSGQVVYKNVVSDKETLSIDMSSNAKGIYMMQLTSGGATYRSKVNIQ